MAETGAAISRILLPVVTLTVLLTMPGAFVAPAAPKTVASPPAGNAWVSQLLISLQTGGVMGEAPVQLSVALIAWSSPPLIKMTPSRHGRAVEVLIGLFFIGFQDAAYCSGCF